MSFRRFTTCTDDHGDAVAFVLLISLVATLFFPASAQPSVDPRTDPYQYRLSGSMAVIIVILIAALFFMAFFSVYIRHCSDSNTVRPAAGGVAGRSRRAARGLDPSVIESFPTLVYSEVKEHKIGKGALECAVCLNEFEDDETLRLIPNCDHVFHPECIDAWLESHTTCPVCRANLVPQHGDSVHQHSESHAESDLEAQPAAADSAFEAGGAPPVQPPLSPSPVTESEIKTLNRNRTRGSRSNRLRWLFPRSHSTGHSLVQPGDDTDRFTLRLPVEVRTQVINRKLNRATSMVVLGRQGSSMRGYRFGGGEGSSRGKYYRRLERLDRTSKSDRWVLSLAPPFITRMSSVKTPKGSANNGETISGREFGPGTSAVDPSSLPV